MNESLLVHIWSDIWYLAYLLVNLIVKQSIGKNICALFWFQVRRKRDGIDNSTNFRNFHETIFFVFLSKIVFNVR